MVLGRAGGLSIVRRATIAVLGFLALMATAGKSAHADVYVMDAWSNGNNPGGMNFPNWRNVWAGEYGVWLCDGCVGASEILTALTVVNFGSATAGDITNVVWKVQCSSQNSVLYTMTYAGPYTEGSGTYPAWTWTGASPDLNGCSDLCAPGPTCGGWFTIDVYVDITPCPTNQATIAMGFPIDTAGNGSIHDNQGAVVPWYDLVGNESMIAYVYKSGPQNAVPGDTITYTIQYGKPGTAPLTSVEILDPLPPYTHYVFGSAVPAPDVGYDPDLGPPMSLRWTINPVPGNLPAWGPTAEVRFSVSVDWGNGNGFEPGSGDVAAPEGQRLSNVAQVTYNGVAGCGSVFFNPPVNTVVKRFLFWIIGDNDVLFSPTIGQPADEMTYSIFIRNLSTTKQWWDVHLWDTVPADLDAWGPNMGFDDPCSGWTMSPGGCAAASPGRLTAGTKTLLTWRLDMPPGMTLELKWKARVSATAQANGTVINTLSIGENGKTGIAGGTGSSGPPRNFVHLAPIVLPTMYTSYVGYGAGDVCCVGYLIDFFPLNKKTQFELRGIMNAGNPFAIGGGVSASIGSLLGDCIGGFPGGGIAGCKVERIPAKFDPGIGADCAALCPVLPFNYIFKVTSNAPTLWQVLTHLQCHCHDNHTYAPSTTLSYTGLMHYLWRRDSPSGDPASPGNGDCLELINTSMNPYGVFEPGLDTTVHIFQWSYASLSWNIQRTYDLCPESCAYDWNTAQPIEGPFRTISSQGQLIINQGMLTNPQLAIGGHADNEMAYMPTRETGNTVSPTTPGGVPLPANFYGVMEGQSIGSKVVISNVSPGVANATYRIWRYVPDALWVISRWPSWLSDNCGTWQLKSTQVVPAGMAAASNPRNYNADGTFFDQSNTLIVSKVELLSGGPIEVAHGIRVGSFWSGGSVVHPTDGKQAGLQYWMSIVPSSDAKAPCANREMFYVDVFCPKQGMAVRMTSEDGYSASYTTTGPDQVVAFMALTSDATRNFRVDVLPNPAQGGVLCQLIACAASEKGYTAPFLQQGVHYEFIAPPVVYVGQSFWITVVVKEVGGATKLDYCGTTSFTSSDPGAKIEGTPMDTYNFGWSGTICDINGGTANENGVRIFMNVTFTKIGMQTIVGMDTIDGSINGLTAILVVATDIKLSKSPRLVVAASGDTVQFRVCWSNYSSASAFSFTITDAIPVGTTFVPEAGTWAFNCGTGIDMAVGFSTATSATMPPAGSFTGGNPSGAARWLRWTLPYVPVMSTGCACYRVTVN